MVRIKGWYKKEDSLDYILYSHNFRYNLVEIKRDVTTTKKGMWRLTILGSMLRLVSRLFFRTKKEALDYAISYMIEHPKGVPRRSKNEKVKIALN